MPEMKMTTWKRVAGLGALGFGIPIVLLAAIDVVRLWQTGFPPADVEKDVTTFRAVVIPVALVCSLVLALGGVAAIRGSASIVRSLLLISLGAIVPAIGVSIFWSFGITTNLLRCAVAAIGAMCAFLLTSCVNWKKESAKKSL